MVDIALCQEFIGYTSSTEAYALRIRLTANEEAPPSGTDPDVVLEAGEVAEVAADDVHDSSMAWGEDPKMVAFEFESSGEASSGSSLYSVYGTFRLNFHRLDRFDLDLRGHTQVGRCLVPFALKMAVKSSNQHHIGPF